MIKNLILLAFLILTSKLVMACEISMPEKFLILKNDINLNSFSKDCSDVITHDLSNLITQSHGKVQTKALTMILSESHNKKIIINPQLIEIVSLNKLISEQLSLDKMTQITNFESIGNFESLIPLDKNDRLKVSCHPCVESGRGAFALTIDNDESTRSLNFSAQMVKKIKAYKIRSHQPAFQSLKSQNLEEVWVEGSQYNEFLSDLKHLNFYKTNKLLRRGDIVKKNDLTGINLVRAGSKTEVELSNSSIQLKTQGISRGNGAIGDQVEIYNPEKKRKYTGEVVDFNKVLINL